MTRDILYADEQLSEDEDTDRVDPILGTDECLEEELEKTPVFEFPPRRMTTRSMAKAVAKSVVARIQKKKKLARMRIHGKTIHCSTSGGQPSVNTNKPLLKVILPITIKFPHQVISYCEWVQLADRMKLFMKTTDFGHSVTDVALVTRPTGDDPVFRHAEFTPIGTHLVMVDGEDEFLFAWEPAITGKMTFATCSYECVVQTAPKGPYAQYTNGNGETGLLILWSRLERTCLPEYVDINRK